jgi:hypothetical protein
MPKNEKRAKSRATRPPPSGAATNVARDGPDRRPARRRRLLYSRYSRAYAGAAVDSMTDIRPAAEVVAELVAELEHRLPARSSSDVR